jgi:hypothetical protein
MTPERWERVRTVFFAALDIHPDLRGALLDRECRADDLLRDEIVSLLDSSERAKNFLTRPAAEIAAGWPARMVSPPKDSAPGSFAVKLGAAEWRPSIFASAPMANSKNERR